MSNSQTLFMSFVHHRFHQVAVNAKKLDSVIARGFNVADALAGLFNCSRRRIDIVNAVSKHSRADEFSGSYVGPPLKSFLAGADIADSSDAACKPHLCAVLDRHRYSTALVLSVRVKIYQARQNVFTGCVDVELTFCRA